MAPLESRQSLLIFGMIVPTGARNGLFDDRFETLTELGSQRLVGNLGLSPANRDDLLLSSELCGTGQRWMPLAEGGHVARIVPVNAPNARSRQPGDELGLLRGVEGKPPERTTQPEVAPKHEDEPRE
jgi:hypothetical protein